MKPAFPSALVASLLLTLAAGAHAQTGAYQEHRLDGNCATIRDYQRDGSFAEERHCVSEGVSDARQARYTPFLRNDERLKDGLRRNRRAYERGEIASDEFRRRQHRLSEALERNGQQRREAERRMARMERHHRDGESDSAGATAAYAPGGRSVTTREGSREIFWRGNCKIERTYRHDGTYAEQRACH